MDLDAAGNRGKQKAIDGGIQSNHWGNHVWQNLTLLWEHCFFPWTISTSTSTHGCGLSGFMMSIGFQLHDTRKSIPPLDGGTTESTSRTQETTQGWGSRRLPEHRDLPNIIHIITDHLPMCKMRCYPVLKCSFSDNFTTRDHFQR